MSLYGSKEQNDEKACHRSLFLRGGGKYHLRIEKGNKIVVTHTVYKKVSMIFHWLRVILSLILCTVDCTVKYIYISKGFFIVKCVVPALNFCFQYTGSKASG